MDKKISLLFDATILANAAIKDSGRSGIFFTAYQMALQLKNRPDVKLSFYCSRERQALLKTIPEFKHIQIYPFNSCFDAWSAKIRRRKMQAKKNRQYIRKIFWHYWMFLFRFLFFIPNLIVKALIARHQVSTEIFLSSVYVFPDKINIKRKKYIVLYDTIPLLFEEYYPDVQKGNAWLLDVTKQLRSDPNCCAFAISEQTKKDFLKFVPELKPEQITVTPLACADTFHPCSKEETIKSLQKYHLPIDKKYVFSLCSLEPRKNLIRAVKTFIEFIKKNNLDDIVFILGGGHWDDFINKLNAEIVELGDYQDKIIRAGYIDDEDLAPLYSGAKWFVYTSQYEGFGLPPLEAMACGCPVITSNNSSLPEVVGDAGIMIDWDSDEQHIKAYEDYYFHPELRERNKQKGLVRAKQFSWDKTVDLMVKEMMK